LALIAHPDCPSTNPAMTVRERTHGTKCLRTHRVAG
jgi:hypothetical protein